MNGIIWSNLVGIIGGTILLSLEFGWKVGVGIGLLMLFHKHTEKA